jgi:hypothetical protein
MRRLGDFAEVEMELVTSIRTIVDISFNIICQWAKHQTTGVGIGAVYESWKNNVV